jgi:hypothetical protein
MRRLSREVFRRSFLTLLPECSLAGAVSLAVAMAAYYVDLSGGWGGLCSARAARLVASGANAAMGGAHLDSH